MRRLYRWLDDPGLLDRLAALQQRDPDQFGPAGEPRGPKAKALQNEIEAVGDPAELLPKLDQARRVEVRRKADLDEFLREHLDAVLGDLRPEAEARTAAINAKLKETAAELDGHVGFIQRLESLVAAAGGQPRTIQGLDQAAELKRVVERAELPAPIGDGP